MQHVIISGHFGSELIGRSRLYLLPDEYASLKDVEICIKTKDTGNTHKSLQMPTKLVYRKPTDAVGRFDDNMEKDAIIKVNTIRFNLDEELNERDDLRVCLTIDD